jgi:ribonucleotide reductase alpha subunit
MSFDSNDARRLNKEIFETIYYAALTASADLAKQDGHYESYEGSPISKGILQHDLWGVETSSRWDWNSLRAKIKTYGVRNSLLMAPMPTASTSQILGNNECIEPVTSNIYTRRVLSGEFAMVNKHLVRDLIQLGLWNEEMKDRIIAHNGSVQYIPEIPADMKELYRTVWEIKQKSILEMAADRGAFIDQSQSLNVHMEDTNFGKLSSLHFAAWKLGLKTGMYYLRTRPAVDAIKFTIKEPTQTTAAEQAAAMVCSLENPEACVSCGS